MQRFGYNTNTLGNICEGILALGMRNEQPAVTSLARTIENGMRAAHRRAGEMSAERADHADQG